MKQKVNHSLVTILLAIQFSAWSNALYEIMRDLPSLEYACGVVTTVLALYYDILVAFQL
jgi:hypothetical protein